MNRLWIGIAILVLIVAFGVGIWWGSALFFGDFSREMQDAGEAAVAEDWALAVQKAEKCREKWERFRPVWASLTDHAPVEQVQLLFSQLELYEAEKRAAEFAVCCRSLAKEAEAIEESHGLAWWSIL
jgi:hypothetical protein